MEKEIFIMLNIPSNCLIDVTNTRVTMNAKYNRKKHKNDKTMDVYWQKRIAENPTLFNGTKFRLHSISLQDNIVMLNLGITCYKEFLCTNWSEDAGTLSQNGKTDFNDPQAYMSDALGVGAFVCTADNKAILLKRSNRCAEAVGLWDIPGGHPEPKEIVGKISAEEIDIENMDQQRVVEEMYDSITREVVDEANIPVHNLSKPILIGVARNLTSSGRPSAEFLIRCSLTSAEVQNLYRKGSQEEAYESTNIHFMTVEDINQLTENHEIWNQLAPSAKGCLVLYRMYMNKTT